MPERFETHSALHGPINMFIVPPELQHTWNNGLSHKAVSQRHPCHYAVSRHLSHVTELSNSPGSTYLLNLLTYLLTYLLQGAESFLRS